MLQTLLGVLVVAAMAFGISMESDVLTGFIFFAIVAPCVGVWIGSQVGHDRSMENAKTIMDD